MEVMKSPSRADGSPLEFMSPTLRNDQEVVLEAVKKNGYSIGHASAQLQASLMICLAAVHQNGLALELCAPAKRDDESVVSPAIRQNVASLQHASERLRGDAAILGLAVAQAGAAWRTKVLPHTTVAMRVFIAQIEIATLASATATNGTAAVV